MKSKYETHVAPRLAEIERWAREGSTEREIAKALGVAYSTFRGYLERGEKGEEPYDQLVQQFRAGNQIANEQVEAALFRRATGYTYEEVMEEDGPNGTRRRVTTKTVPPDATAAMFWLRNLKPEQWGERWRKGGDDKDAGEQGVVILAEPGEVADE